MRRLGVAESDLDDAMQELLSVLAERVSDIEEGKEKSFVMGTAFRIASEHRRRRVRRREVTEDQAPELADVAADLETLPDATRARALLDRLLDEMPLDLRAAIILVDIEERSLDEIADILSIPRGTAASRVRRAREDFDGRVKRMQAKHTTRSAS